MTNQELKHFMDNASLEEVVDFLDERIALLKVELDRLRQLKIKTALILHVKHSITSIEKDE